MFFFATRSLFKQCAPPDTEQVQHRNTYRNKFCALSFSIPILKQGGPPDAMQSTHHFTNGSGALVVVAVGDADLAARPTREVVAGPRHERWQEKSVSVPSRSVQSPTRRTRDGGEVGCVCARSLEVACIVIVRWTREQGGDPDRSTITTVGWTAHPVHGNATQTVRLAHRRWCLRDSVRQSSFRVAECSWCVAVCAWNHMSVGQQHLVGYSWASCGP